MDVEKLSESVKKIKMSEESKKRIAQKCLEESQRRNEGLPSTVTRPRAGRKIFRVTAAAVLILCSATAVMAGSGIFKNPSIVKDVDEIREIESEGE